MAMKLAITTSPVARPSMPSVRFTALLVAVIMKQAMNVNQIMPSTTTLAASDGGCTTLSITGVGG